MVRLPVPGLGSSAIVQGLLARIAGSGVGRVLAPAMAALGLHDRSNSFILNIGDEGATLVQIHGGQIVDAVFAEATAEEGWDAMRELLRGDPRARIILIADVLEQMFREDTVPKVGFFDRGKIVKRRLDLTYPNDILKAALPLPRQRGAPQAVLFTALPMSEHLQRWVAFLDEFPNPLAGFYMLPMEVVGVANRLAPSAQGETRRVWRALITQEAASGFRQIFESGGRLIVTRLTQRAAQPLTPDAEAMLIERELRSSISYIKRLGFSDADRLDVVILADPAVCRAVDDRDLPATTVTVNTPYQAGVLLGLGEVGREDSPFADVLLGLWIARKRRQVLTLPTPRIRQQMQMTSIIRASTAATAALTLLAIYYTGSLVDTFVAGGTDIKTLQSQLDTTKTRLNAELSRMKSSPIPLDELTEVADNERHFADDEIDVATILQKISKALANDARVSNMAYTLLRLPAQPSRPAPRASKPPPGGDSLPPYEIKLIVKFPKSGDAGSSAEAALGLAKAVLGRLADAFPDCTVQAVHLPTDMIVNQILEGSSSAALDTSQTNTQGAPTAEFSIRKGA
jgi:hypothetical protein